MLVNFSLSVHYSTNDARIREGQDVQTGCSQERERETWGNKFVANLIP